MTGENRESACQTLALLVPEIQRGGGGGGGGSEEPTSPSYRLTKRAHSESYGRFSGRKHPRSECQILGGCRKKEKPNHIWKIADNLFEGDV